MQTNRISTKYLYEIYITHKNPDSTFRYTTAIKELFMNPAVNRKLTAIERSIKVLNEWSIDGQ